MSLRAIAEQLDRIASSYEITPWILLPAGSMLETGDEDGFYICDVIALRTRANQGEVLTEHGHVRPLDESVSLRVAPGVLANARK